jgi:hypothetical protein
MISAFCRSDFFDHHSEGRLEGDADGGRRGR